MIVHVSQTHNYSFIDPTAYGPPIHSLLFLLCLLVLTENATRYCYPNGTWESANFDQCQYLGEATAVNEFTPTVDLPFYIYCIGYVLSLISLSLALIVFIHFKQVFLIHSKFGNKFSFGIENPKNTNSYQHENNLIYLAEICDACGTRSTQIYF